MGKVALVIIYNHRYEKNIDILERIYSNRFSHIYHLMPFYNGAKSNVITVYENSYRFEGYIAQGIKSFFKDDFTHYFFIADDLLLNTRITEKNYAELLKLDHDTCFLPEFITLHERTQWWSRVGEAYQYNIHCRGVEVEGQLPNYDGALQALKENGLEIKPLKYNQIYSEEKFPKQFYNVKKVYEYLKWHYKNIKKRDYHLSYPLVGGYSDIFVVSGEVIKKFSQFCGAFAVTNLFPELAIPTALALSTKKIITENNLKIKGKALWTEDEFSELDKFNNQLKSMIDNFPKDYIYLHPVKLSKLNVEL